MEQTQVELRRFHKNVEYYEAHQDALLAQYPDQWVAIFNEQVVGTDPDYLRLLEDLKAKSIPLGKVFIQRASDEDELLILAS